MTDENRIFLSTLPPGSRDRRLALAVVLVSAVVFLAVAPFAKVNLAPVPAFLPIYQTALVTNDLITAVLLYGQYRILGSRALLLLAGGYLFSALMAIAHLLSFPGLFAADGLLGAGSQTTAWLYFLWHAIFPLCVIGYALDKNQEGMPDATGTAAGLPIVTSVALAFAAAGALALIATAGHDALPRIMHGDRDAPAKLVVGTACWMLSLAALAVLWRRRRSLLDLWLMVVMCVWIFDIALASVLNAGRFDVGWYAGRIYGLLAASFVLVILLLENSVLYARLVEAHARERAKRGELEQRTADLVAVNRELDSFSYSVSHDLRAPLRAVDGFTRILEEDYAARLDDEGRRLLGVVREGAARMSQLIEDLLAFARLGRQPLKTRRVELDALVNQTIAEIRAAHAGRRIDFMVGTLGATEADPALLKQALANLLNNAIKFTRDRDPAVVEVGCAEAAQQEEPGNVYFVKDNGVGFDMRYYDKLFGVFQRLHRAEDYEGTGVGLAIVQKVITRHGGRVWADAAIGTGATFYFTLPRAAGEPEIAAAAQA